MNRNCDGVLIIDKPENVSSAKAVAIVKRCLAAAKVGHTGTLDPFATGVLVCCINQATRLAQFLMQGMKSYDATLCLGVETDTQDATGTVVREAPVTVSDREIRTAMADFIGEQLQKPPMFSALKHQGKPLYRLARMGKPVQKPARQVHIESIDVQDIRLPWVRFAVTCSAGTYIRTLCNDIGHRLGCGGHLKSLRRTETGGFTIDDAISLDAVSRCKNTDEIYHRTISMADAMAHLPVATVNGETKTKLQHGRSVKIADFRFAAGPPARGLFSVIDESGRLTAVMETSGPDKTCTYCCVFQ